ncbi:toll/interleukin-1 receptor domain-containing protein [Alcaligenes faecalis subsp. phenolicus]|uniref:toll/interleukin-1 receptor domain-containing protein n=1 Tax=Alcaligenes nematophilus TaxID=2994643 RepID=UPI002AA3D6B6|nr:toll/interleukin-1 receptor domain-containing protein [Alcaligenes phenolicus]
MVRNITRAELREIKDSLSVNDQQALRIEASSRSLSGSTFLSHSSKDQELVVGAIRILENHGGQVYVDEVDPAMPPYTTDETAQLLKQRIYQTNRFVLLASKNSQDSRWVPWELGIADGTKGLGKIALFPASDSTDDDTWASWEYLGLYRRIVWGDLQGYEKPLWMVLDKKKNTATPLSTWLKGGG